VDGPWLGCASRGDGTGGGKKKRGGKKKKMGGRGGSGGTNRVYGGLGKPEGAQVSDRGEQILVIRSKGYILARTLADQSPIATSKGGPWDKTKIGIIDKKRTTDREIDTWGVGQDY